VWHITWLVNSAAHRWGYQNYATGDSSRNNWWVGLISNGEGWHNNHHAAPRSAAHGHKWYEFDVTYLMIRALELVGLAFLAFGGIPYVLWAVFFRTTYGLHATWLVNSATHLWGSRRFKTKDDSTNLWWVALLTFGEGWHNNHHAHPVSARHGLAWYELDINYINISVLRALGLVWDVKTAHLEHVHRMPQQTADAVDITKAEPALD